MNARAFRCSLPVLDPVSGGNGKNGGDWGARESYERDLWCMQLGVRLPASPVFTDCEFRRVFSSCRWW
jgi:hypothetical protein